jgi:hypothetical protein
LFDKRRDRPSAALTARSGRRLPVGTSAVADPASAGLFLKSLCSPSRPNSQMSPIADAPNISRIAQLTKPMTMIGMSSRRIIFAPSIPSIRNCLPGHCKIATQPLTDIFASPRRSRCSNRSQSAIEPVSVRGANSCRESVWRGQRPRRDFCRRRSISCDRDWNSFAPFRSKPREVEDISTGGRKPDLCRTAWWRMQF